MIRWNHTHDTDWKSHYGEGIRPMIRTEHPDNVNTLISELPRALRAARRAYARYYGVRVGEVTASPVYTEGRASVAYVNAYIAGPPFSAKVDAILSERHPGWSAGFNGYADYDSVEIEKYGENGTGYVQRDGETGLWDAEHINEDGANSGSVQFDHLADAVDYAVTGTVTAEHFARHLGAEVGPSGDIMFWLTGGAHVAITADAPGWFYNAYDGESEKPTAEGGAHGTVEDVVWFIREQQRAAGITPNV